MKWKDLLEDIRETPYYKWEKLKLTILFYWWDIRKKLRK
jgi:hypothetical protein